MFNRSQGKILSSEKFCSLQLGPRMCVVVREVRLSLASLPRSTGAQPVQLSDLASSKAQTPPSLCPAVAVGSSPLFCQGCLHKVKVVPATPLRGNPWPTGWFSHFLAESGSWALVSLPAPVL